MLNTGELEREWSEKCGLLGRSTSSYINLPYPVYPGKTRYGYVTTQGRQLGQARKRPERGWRGLDKVPYGGVASSKAR